MVEAVQEHLGQVVHGLPLPLRQRVELVEDEVGDGFGDGGPLERGLAQRPFYVRLRSSQDAFAEELKTGQI